MLLDSEHLMPQLRVAALACIPCVLLLRAGSGPFARALAVESFTADLFLKKREFYSRRNQSQKKTPGHGREKD